MALPNRNQQIESIMKFLDSDSTEGRELREIAADIADSYMGLLTEGFRKATQPMREGMLFKGPDGKVRRVVWMDGGVSWTVSENDSYGCLIKEPYESWQYCEEYRPRRRRDGKMAEMTDEQIAEEWSNPDFSVGDTFSRHQRRYWYTVVAAGPRCVLMRDRDSALLADSNASLHRHYRREK